MRTDGGRVGVEWTGSKLGLALVAALSGPLAADAAAQTWKQEAKLVAPDATAGDQFGNGAAVSGDTMIVASVSHEHHALPREGGAYVFVRTGGAWGFQAELMPGAPAAWNEFGTSVDVDGDTAVVGARQEVPGQQGPGAVYVFTRSGTTWTQQAMLMAAGGVPNDSFGVSVDLQGDTLVVGADREGMAPGCAYVFERSGTAWSQVATLTPSVSASDRFGNSVALDGDRIVVGAFKAAVGPLSTAGVAYLFRKQGTWSSTSQEDCQLTAADAAAQDWFGISVDVHGSTIVVGASLADPGGSAEQGAAYVFVDDGTACTQQAKLVAGAGGAGDNFGIRVAAGPDLAVVGAQQADPGGLGNAGAAYVFRREGTAWTETQGLSAGDKDPGDSFGYSVAVDGTTIAVGAVADELGGLPNAGSAYVFSPDAAAACWGEEAKLVASDPMAGDQLGGRIAVSGDTVVVSAVLHEHHAIPREGAAYVFRRVRGTWIQETELTASTPLAWDEFGTSVAVDGDTAVVGARQGVPGQWGPGAAYVFLRSGTTWTQQAILTATGGAPNDDLGVSVDLQGDTLVVGADREGKKPGCAYVFQRTGTTWSQVATLTPSVSTADRFGFAVALDGDRIVVGAHQTSIGGLNSAGAAYLFRRSSGGWTTTNQEDCKLTAGDAAALDEFGFSVDVRGDTIVVGARNADLLGHPTTDNHGAAYLFVDDGTNCTQQAKITASDGQPGDRFGVSSALGQDLVVVGASQPNIGAVCVGRAYVFSRTGTAWSELARLSPGDVVAGDTFGSSVAISGTTIAVGAVVDDVAGLTDAGSAYVFTPEAGPVAYCTAKVNSCGTLPAISITGRSSAAATSGFVIEGSRARFNKLGLLIYTNNGRREPAVAFQGGLLCINSPIKRAATVGSIGGTAMNCDATFSLDMNAFAHGLAGGNPQAWLLVPGTLVDAQWWGRDTFAHGSYLTDAIEFRICP